MKINTKLSKSKVQASSNYKIKIDKKKKRNENPNNYFHKFLSFSLIFHLIFFFLPIPSPLEFIETPKLLFFFFTFFYLSSWLLGLAFIPGLRVSQLTSPCFHQLSLSFLLFLFVFSIFFFLLQQLLAWAPSLMHWTLGARQEDAW